MCIFTPTPFIISLIFLNFGKPFLLSSNFVLIYILTFVLQYLTSFILTMSLSLCYCDLLNLILSVNLFFFHIYWLCSLIDIYFLFMTKLPKQTFCTCYPGIYNNTINRHIQLSLQYKKMGSTIKSTVDFVSCYIYSLQ